MDMDDRWLLTINHVTASVHAGRYGLNELLPLAGKLAAGLDQQQSELLIAVLLERMKEQGQGVIACRCCHAKP
ncbi:hypothetical protein [Andreprevotia lacus]|uniref:hypothetical protein n=1 Tax=Andreprevotia lacus TaxID=1121000 RepID=UPI00111BF4C4|nr:hypothetical protein [Andreprevotia lacus]